MNTIVSGGAGFIGSHLAELLLNAGHSVKVIDNFSNGRPENLAHLKNNSRLSVVNTDIADFENIEKHFEKIDWVFHLAALADIVPSVQKPLDYHRANVDGTANMLHASHLAGVKRFIYAASSSCYGIPPVYPTTETTPCSPQYPYALTKYVGEQYVMHWGQVYKLPVVSLRMFNVYGPRSRTSGTYGAVFGVFLAQKLAGKPFTVVGDGTQLRDFVFVKDVARAYLAAAESEVKDIILNVGGGKPQSVNRLVELLGGPVTYIPKRPGEPDRTHADTTLIKKYLGWEPSVSFEEGVKIMLDNIDYWRNAPVWTTDSIKAATEDWFKNLEDKNQTEK